MICLYADSFTVGTRWSAFQAGKAILSFILYSKSAGEIMGALAKIDSPDGAPLACMWFIALYVTPCLIINGIIASFFVNEQEEIQAYLVAEDVLRKDTES